MSSQLLGVRGRCVRKEENNVRTLNSVQKNTKNPGNKAYRIFWRSHKWIPILISRKTIMNSVKNFWLFMMTLSFLPIRMKLIFRKQWLHNNDSKHLLIPLPQIWPKVHTQGNEEIAKAQSLNQPGHLQILRKLSRSEGGGLSSPGHQSGAGCNVLYTSLQAVGMAGPWGKWHGRAVGKEDWRRNQTHIPSASGEVV